VSATYQTFGEADGLLVAHRVIPWTQGPGLRL